MDNEYNPYELFADYENKFYTDDYIDVLRGRVIYDKDKQLSIIYIYSC